jgi:hypothetical protein
MRWFDRDFVTGGLSDEVWTERRTDYEAHLSDIRPRLKNGAEALVTSVHLHDGQVAEWEYQPGESFVVRVLVGDLQVGYEWLTLDYRDASLTGNSELDLTRWWSTLPPNEIIEDELDLSGDDRYEHRMLLWPEGEVGVQFGALHPARRPASPSDRR